MPAGPEDAKQKERGRPGSLGPREDEREQGSKESVQAVSEAQSTRPACASLGCDSPVTEKGGGDALKVKEVEGAAE